MIREQIYKKMEQEKLIMSDRFRRRLDQTGLAELTARWIGVLDLVKEHDVAQQRFAVVGILEKGPLRIASADGGLELRQVSVYKRQTFVARSDSCEGRKESGQNLGMLVKFSEQELEIACKHVADRKYKH